jgi:tRNA pseudouridine55 synthase
MPRQTTNGLLVLDKPAGITSRRALDRALSWFPRNTRAGHTGTLDPLATGVLVLCLGSATRLTEYVQDMAKTYRATLRFGARSDTDDADGTIEPVAGAVPPERTAVQEALRCLVGDIEQVPPAYSAAKVSGRRAHDLARSGRDVSLKARCVHVHSIDLLPYEYPRLEIEVRCGKGTYIRSLARDLGERLGCGGYVETLRRISVGPFRAEDAIALDTDAAVALARLLPVSAALSELPSVTLGPEAIARLRQGRAVACLSTPGEVCVDGSVAVLDGAGELVAVGVRDTEAGLLRPEKVL